MKGYEMTRDDLIKLAKQADMWGETGSVFAEHVNPKVEELIKLVEEHCCSVIRGNIQRNGHDTKEYVFAFKLIDAIKRGQE